MKGDDLVPVEPFRRLIERKIVEHGWDDDPITRVAARSGLPDRAIRRIMSEQGAVEFSTADALVTRLEGPMLWHEDEELSSIYWGVNLEHVDIINPIDAPGPRAHADRALLEAWDSHSNKREAAKSIGISAVMFAKRLDGALLRSGRDLPVNYRASQCRNGHSRKEFGTYSDGTCKQCRKEKNARRRKKMKSEKPSPHYDPTVPHPGKVFYAGSWRSPEFIEAHRARNRKAAA